MASLTIRNLDDSVKAQLRIRAALNGRSMEAEARALLWEAVGQGRQAKRNPFLELHERFKAIGGVELPEIPRELDRDPPDFSKW